MDLGCSSMQFDTPSRGFALSKDGPLDMRMDGNRYGCLIDFQSPGLSVLRAGYGFLVSGSILQPVAFEL